MGARSWTAWYDEDVSAEADARVECTGIQLFEAWGYASRNDRPSRYITHVWHFLAPTLDEGQAAIGRIGAFVREHLRQ